MRTKRVRTGQKPGEVSPNVWADFEWAREHREELLKEYGECIVLIYEQKVVGRGMTYEAAMEDAESRLPADFTGEITPITQILRHRHPFYRVRPQIIKDSN